jgi:hypothetical protein
LATSPSLMIFTGRLPANKVFSQSMPSRL